MVELIMMVFVLILIILLFIAANKKLDEKCQPCTWKHEWELVSSSKNFDYYECANPKCNHSKGHHK
jgi:hypothetical protein